MDDLLLRQTERQLDAYLGCAKVFETVFHALQTLAIDPVEFLDLVLEIPEYSTLVLDMLEGDTAAATAHDLFHIGERPLGIIGKVGRKLQMLSRIAGDFFTDRLWPSSSFKRSWRIRTGLVAL